MDGDGNGEDTQTKSVIHVSDAIQEAEKLAAVQQNHQA